MDVNKGEGGGGCEQGGKKVDVNKGEGGGRCEQGGRRWRV